LRQRGRAPAYHIHRGIARVWQGDVFVPVGNGDSRCEEELWEGTVHWFGGWGQGQLGFFGKAYGKAGGRFLSCDGIPDRCGRRLLREKHERAESLVGHTVP